MTCKTCDIPAWEWHVLHQHWYTFPIALPLRRNPQHRSHCDCCLSHFRTSVSTSASSAKRLAPRLNRFTRQTLPTVNRKHVCMNILCTEFFCPQKRTTERCSFGSWPLNHGRHFYYWNQPPNMRMCVCYLDYHEAGLCCYVVIHIKNLIRLFYLHLWRVYWLLRIWHKDRD
jgi:hypothetical protein